MRRISLEEAFWSKVDQRGADECWPWTGALGSKGYGVIHRRSNGRSAMLRATQVSWALANGKPWPKPLFACHSCDNPQCVNPAHIWPGTNAENMTDMFDKGRRRAWVCRHAGTPTFGTQGMSRCRACRSEYDRERSQLRTQRRREAKLARQAESRSMNTQSQIQAAATRNRGERIMFTIQISGTILDSATTLDGAIAIARREASGDTGVDIYREGKHVRRFYQPRVWGDR